MNCENARDSLAEYVTGQMAPERQAEMDAHMAECKECRRVLGVARKWLAAECKDIRGPLVDYALWKDRGGETPQPHEDTAGAWVGIEGHLAQCESCVRELAEARRVMRVFGDTSTTREAFAIIQSMFKENASSAHIEVSEFGALVKMRKHGCLVPYDQEFDPAAAELLIARLRRMLRASLVDDGEGETSFRAHGTEFTVSGSFFRTAWGQAAVLKLAEPPLEVTLEEIGASESELTAVRAILSGTPGLVVLCGVPDQPLRNVRFAVGSYLSANGEHAVYDIEEFTPKQIKNIKTIKASSDLGADIAKVLNYDPDVVSIGSVTDVSALGKVIEFASQGHWVILQFPDDNIDLVADKLLESEWKVDIAQLLRVVCRLKQAPVLRGDPDPGRYVRMVTLYEADLTDRLHERRRKVLLDAGKLDDRAKATQLEPYKLIALEDSASDRVAQGLMRQVEADLVIRFEQCFTSDTLRCIEQGRELAISEASEYYTSGHLLRAMVESKEATVRTAFKTLGISRRTVADRLPASLLDETAVAPFAPKLSWQLEVEFCIATMFSGDRKIAPEDMLNGMLYEIGPRLMGEILENAGGKKPLDPGTA